MANVSKVRLAIISANRKKVGFEPRATVDLKSFVKEMSERGDLGGPFNIGKIDDHPTPCLAR